jgi:predicted nucleotidyltransferase
MKTAGIVAEFDPFHSGHALLLAQARQLGATHIAVIMSESFTQRGEPAVFGAAARCRAAMACGADLVLGLPLPWSCAAAEIFARGAVSSLAALGSVDMLCFGSESADIPLLTRAAQAFASLDGSAELKEALAGGVSYPRARAQALAGLGHAELARLGPNDILAAEYIKALRRAGSGIIPAAVKRAGSPHDSGLPDGGGPASASAIRELLRAGETEKALSFVPEAASGIYRREIAQGLGPLDFGAWELAALSRLRAMDARDFARLPDVSEGLENRLERAAKKAVTLDEFYALVKSRRYTLARIRRTALCGCLGVTRGLSRGAPPYLRVLGLNARGAQILARHSASLPVISRGADVSELAPRARALWDICRSADDLRALCLPVRRPGGLSLRGMPVFADTWRGDNV